MKRIFCVAAALLVASSGAAFARHGKAGLWNITTTMNMAMAFPPEVMAQMKKQGIKMPGAQTMTSQMCMTEAEVDSDKPPQMSNDKTGCVSHVLSQTPSSMTADMVCKNGEMQGTGHVQVSYNGAEHYTGSYAFKAEGQPSGISSSFKGDWVKADCGAVKPYTAK